MRITFILPYAGLAGGIRVVAIYAQRLKERGHEVRVISTPWIPPGRKARAWAALRQWLHKANPRADGVLDPSHFDGLEVEHTRIKEARPVIDADVPDGDVVIATWWETAPWVAALSPRKGAKAYFIQHFEVHEGQPIERVKATWRLPLHKIVVARWLAEAARMEFGDHDVSIAPNSVDHRQFFAPPRRKQPKPSVGLMYSSHHYKGSDICLRAVELAHQRVPDLQLRGFGMATLNPPPRLRECTRYIELPRQDEIREVYAACDAWLFGSRSEGFGLPILEAMACRTPVIAAPAGAAPELLAGGGGVMVKPEDAADMAAAIVRFAAMSEQEWRTYSDAAHETAAKYTWEDATDLFEAGLNRAIERTRRGELVTQ